MENEHLSGSNKTMNDSKLNSPITSAGKPNQVGSVILYGIPIVSLVIENQERLCLAQISNTLLKQYSYNEIHNRRVALGITCVQCTPVQLEILRRAGAMPVSSRRCGMITRREAERLCKSFLGDNAPPRLPDDFAFSVHHECAWGCRGAFLPSRYNSSRAKCIKCTYCGLFFSPNKFIFHSHRMGGPTDKYIQPDAANFNSWRRHMKLSGTPPDEIIHAWEDVKAMFNGGTRKRLLSSATSSSSSSAGCRSSSAAKQAKTSNVNNVGIFPVPSVTPVITPTAPARVPPFPELPLPTTISRSLVMDYMWHNHQTNKHSTFSFPPYSTLPWLKRSNNAPPLLFTPESTSLLHRFHSGLEKSPMSSVISNQHHHLSAFRPVQSIMFDHRTQPPGGANSAVEQVHSSNKTELSDNEDEDDDEVDIETTDDKSIIISNIPSGSESPTSSRHQWSPKHELMHQSDIQLRGSSSSLAANSPLNLSPKSDADVVGSIPHQTTPPLMMAAADRLWSISRITQQMSPPIERALSPPHRQYLYHPVPESTTNRNRDHFNSRSNSPISVKALDCTACQNVGCNNHQTIDNSTKLPA